MRRIEIGDIIEIHNTYKLGGKYKEDNSTLTVSEVTDDGQNIKILEDLGNNLHLANCFYLIRQTENANTIIERLDKLEETWKIHLGLEMKLN